MKKLFLIILCGFLPTFLTSRVSADGEVVISIDMDPFHSPANSATQVGSVEDCARINENDQLDADETEVDSLQADLVFPTPGISAQNPLLAFSTEISFPPEGLNITAAQDSFLLTVNEGSSLFRLNEPLPAKTGFWRSQGADIGNGVAESGPGVLERLSVESVSGAQPGFYSLALLSAYTIDPNNDVHALRLTGNGLVAINQACKPSAEIESDEIIAGPTSEPPEISSETISTGASQLPATGGQPKERLKIAAFALMIIGGIVVAVSEIIIAVAYYKGKH